MTISPPQRISLPALSINNGMVARGYTGKDRDRDRCLVLDYLRLAINQATVTDTRIKGSVTTTVYKKPIRGYRYELRSYTYELTHDCNTGETTVSRNGVVVDRATQAAHRYLETIDESNEDTTVLDALRCAVLADLRPTHYLAVEQSGKNAEDMSWAAAFQCGILESTLDYLTHALTKSD